MKYLEAFFSLQFEYYKYRSIRQLLATLKRRLILAIKYIPYRITAYWRKTPDFIIIGVMKGGTTSLFEYLEQHPDIKMSREKEVHYFSNHYYRSKWFYKSFFPLKTDQRLTGEATPYYFFHPLVPERIKRDFPKTKIILLLRDPVTRAHSNYNMIKKFDWANSFEHALSIEKERVGAHQQSMEKQPFKVNLSYQAYSYFSKGMYFKQLSNWLKYYKKEDILILKSEDFFENPKSQLQKVYEYLNVSICYPEDLKARNNRQYTSLNSTEYQKLKMLFKNDQSKLYSLLGNPFSW